MISFWLYGRAVSILGASNGSAFAALSPVMTTLLAIPILGERPATSDWIAMLLISGGVYIASGGHGVRNRHSDNEKSCNDLKGAKTPKMSERPLKVL
ncbi:EamA family transporter [Bradyrhizobium genosp. P]|uniref:EamA family transporter n=1 Tax=Bradyrhizobium genosp. P TaxID=83641 RepID=UPI003CF87156